MKNEDIIVEAAKRTLVEVKQQIKSTPPVAVPFAVVGLIVGHWWATVVVIILMLAWEGYDQYKEILEEMADDSADDATDAEVQVQDSTETDEKKDQ